MIPMGMGKNQVIIKPIFPEQFMSEPPDPCSSVNNNGVIALGPDLYAGGIPPVFDVLLT
jgi:hypothetical protein